MLKTYLQARKSLVEKTLINLLETPIIQYDRLYEAMRYSLLLGGKRIRPILSMMVLDSLGRADYEQVLPTLCAIEFIHSYSLVHDDLPAMDDDDYRRGKLTNHKVYGEGMAILAGDGLLTHAFSLVTSDLYTTSEQKVQILHWLSTCAGPAGMVGGQAFDLVSEGKSLSLEELQVLHRGKTGALFCAAIAIGLLLAGESTESIVWKAYMDYADKLGLLFQITDDILDETGTLEDLGKMPGSDQHQEKATYVSILGLEGARERAHAVGESARQALANVPQANTSLLLGLVDYLLHRKA